MGGRTGRALLFGVMVLLLVLAWRGQHAVRFGPRDGSGGWLLAAALAALLAARVTRGADPPPPAPGPPPPPRAEWLAFAALLAIGVAFRLIHFTTVPAGMNHDAAFNGMYALHVLQGAPYTPYVAAAWGRETLFMYMLTPLVHWMGNGPEPIQLAAALTGIAALPLFYAFARALCGPRVALVGLAFLAVSGWHGVFSRVGWRMITVPPFELLALVGLWRALETGARRDWVLTGVGAALSIYTYDAGRGVPILVAGLFGLFLLIDRARRRVRLLGGFAALLVFLIVGAPMLWYAAAHFEQFEGRAVHLTHQRESESGVLHNALTAAAMFNVRGNGNDFFVHEPLLEPMAGALFVCGTVVVLMRPRRREHLFLLVGGLLAVLPGVLAIPNGNRCITVLPFVYVVIAIGLTRVASAAAGLLPAGSARGAARALLLVLPVAVAAGETYREFLGANRRDMLGFSPDATAAGQYLRAFDDRYARYAIAEDWPEYTLAYLSYNGTGSPLENQYVLGRRLEDIEARINRFGRKGLVFVTDLKPAGRAALERLRRLFADHRVEPVTAPRLGGRVVATALIVEPHGARRTGPWSNTTRVLSVGGPQDVPARAGATRCFDAIGDAQGVSARLQVMLAEPGDPHEVGEVHLLSQCPPSGAPRPGSARAAAAPVAIAVTARGLEVRADHSESAVPWSGLEAGRWYEVYLAAKADGTVEASVDGTPLAADRPLAVRGRRPLRIAGLQLLAPRGGAPGGQFFIDDIRVIPGIAGAGDPRWAAGEEPDTSRAFAEDFETAPYGALAPGAQWLQVEGTVAVLASPSGAPSAPAPVAEAGNAFDGGRGTRPGRFDQPIGIAVDPAGNIYVADRNNHRIQKFRRDGSYVKAWGTLGDQPGQLREPHDVAADAEFVYVADTWNQRVQVFDGEGNPVFIITGKPSLSSPRGVFAKDKRIYVAEAGAGAVRVFDRAGELLRTIGEPGGDAAGHLVEPVDVVVDGRGRVIVLNSGNNRFEQFSPDGKPIGSIPIPGWTGNRLKESYLAIDAADTLYVTDWEQGAVRRFRPDGTELPPLGTAIGQPSGVALDAGRLLVTARAEDVVRVLLFEQAPSRSPTKGTRTLTAGRCGVRNNRRRTRGGRPDGTQSGRDPGGGRSGAGPLWAQAAFGRYAGRESGGYGCGV